MYLNCHSYFSLRYGTIPVKELVQLAAANNVKALTLTDINCVTGIYDFALECIEKGIKPLVGVEFRNGNEHLFTAIAVNFKGIGEMCRLITTHFNKTPFPPATSFDYALVIYPLHKAPLFLKENEYIGLAPHQIVQLYKPHLKARANRMVIFQPVTFRNQEEYNLHKILRAIDHNIIYTKLGPTDICENSEKMIPLDDLLKAYEDLPEVIRNTEKIIDLCCFDFDFSKSKDKISYTNDRYTDLELLRKIANDGFLRKYSKNDQLALRRLERELEVIGQLAFAGKFLITWDMIRYSQSQGFFHIGRGSGANSIIAYCLGITDICPMELNLYFERFLNAHRTSPPDFDIDWGHKNRDAILEYVFTRYNSNHVGFCGTIGEFKFRSKIRELGKVFGLAKEEMDALTRTHKNLHEKNKVLAAIHKYGAMLENYPNQRSMHSCGVLISEEPITNYTALEMMPKGFPIVQFDMHIAEEIGFEKFDILSQRGISTINETVDMVKKNQGITVNIRDTSLSKNKPELNERLGKGLTIGCFYIESPAMRGLMRRLGQLDYVVLVIASSIIRPGVAKSGMMGEYVHRHNKPDSYEFLDKVFEEHLFETHGVMVFQEDVIKIAIHFGGLDGDSADSLRRAISGKKRSIQNLLNIKQKFFEGAIQRGHSIELTQEVYRQMESFAGFSFCKAHSASYAVESYMSLYLKHYYPIEFMVAAINNEGGFYRTEVYIHEARMSGASIELPCINQSCYDTTVKGKTIHLGFKLIRALSQKMVDQIEQNRNKFGLYTSLEDFISRIPVGIETLKQLIYAGAFRSTGDSKGKMVLKSRMLLSNNLSAENTLFQEPGKELKLPEISRSVFEDAYDEIEIIGFPVSVSPYDLLIAKSRGNTMVKDLLVCNNKTVKMVGYLISTKHVPTLKGDMYFGTWIDAEGYYFDTAHFQDSLKTYNFKGGGCYVLLGTVKIDYNFPTITIHKMEKLPFMPDPRFKDQLDYNTRIHGHIKEDVSTTDRAPYPNPQDVGFKRFK
jgi:error-prone DNA polymerase